MHNFLLYLLKSTLCISLLYLLFRTIMRKESFFAMNRMLLLTIVLASSAIPLLYLPKVYQPPIQVELLPVFAPVKTSPAALPTMETKVASNISVPENPVPAIESSNLVFSVQKFLQYVYLAGFYITLLFLVYSLITILLLFRKARSIKMDGYRLLIIDREIAAFSFGRFVVLSQNDYEEHRQTMLAHEQAHIRLYHFFDLLLLETIRIFHWFNPVIHWLIQDMKEIHEFQADDYTLTKGIDASQYQLLIIQKSVGSQKFALANSFNHCQIKKRIVMMNKQKTSKAWSWKVATFLPLLALLLMAFGRKAETGPPGGAGLSSVEQVVSKDSTKQWTEADFLNLDGFIALKKKGKTPKWIEPDMSVFTMHGKTVTAEKSKFAGQFFWGVQIDSKSQIWINNHQRQLNWNELQDSIRTWVDYDFANDRTKPHFHSSLVNGVQTMAPNFICLILSDKSAPLTDYQRFLNTIGNTILEIRGKYSRDIYKMEYSKLNSEQREQIDILIPLVAMIAKPQNLRPVKDLSQNNISVSVTQRDYSEKNRLPDSSTRAINTDSVKESLINQFYFNENIEFQADKIALDSLKRSTLYLYKNVKVKFQDIKLLADYVELNKDSFLVYATGKEDSTGSITGKPILTIGKDEVNAEGIRYNLKTRKGVTYGITTTRYIPKL